MSTDAIKLPTRNPEVRERLQSEPIWKVQADPIPAATKSSTSNQHERVIVVNEKDPGPSKPACETTTSPDLVCCRTLKGKEERKLINPDIVRDIIIGFSDGLTVPFGLTAGLAAVGTAHVVVVGGVAELVSGALSMGVGGFLSAQAERDHYRYMLEYTRERIKRSCVGEIEREVTDVLGDVGLDEALCRRVALRLLQVEREGLESDREPLISATEKAQKAGLLSDMLEAISRKPKTTRGGSGTPRRDDIGLTAFLLRFAEGEEEVPTKRLFISAFTIGISYAIAGLIPLFPYFFVHDIMTGLYISIGVTAAALVIFGLFKAYFTGGRIGFVGYTKSGIYTLAIGAMAAGSAYGIGRAIEGSSAK